MDGYADVLRENCPTAVMEDAFPADACAVADADGDGHPDPLRENCPTVLPADAFPADACAGPDTDGDGYADAVQDNCSTELVADAFPADACAAADADGDGYADAVQDNCSTALSEDAFPTDACAKSDTDGDGFADLLAIGCVTALIEDAFPTDVCAYEDTDLDGLPNTLYCESGINPIADHDDDNDRLIEIHSLEALASLRDDLNGDGRDDGHFPGLTVSVTAGCPGDGCLGYELAGSLDFGDLESYENPTNGSVWTGGTGWVPVGFCSGTDNCNPWTGVFEGNGHRITGLFINATGATGATAGATTQADRLGLFGAADGIIRNLTLSSARLLGGVAKVGVLVGDAGGSRITRILVKDSFVLSPVADSVGGMAGSAMNATIMYSAAINGLVTGNDAVGGLVGGGSASVVGFSFSSAQNVTGNRQVGGLIGDGSYALVTASHAAVARVNGTDTVGGLIGNATYVFVRASYAEEGSVNGTQRVGGLIGDASYAKISASYARNNRVSGESAVGGIGGLVAFAEMHSSYAANSGLSAARDVHGIGFGMPLAVNDSYWDYETAGVGSGADAGAKTSAELSLPTNFVGIYANWGGFWCDAEAGIWTTDPAHPIARPSRRAWNLQDAGSYPALTCLADLVRDLLP